MGSGCCKNNEIQKLKAGYRYGPDYDRYVAGMQDEYRPVPV